jgi:PAS domain S-box-containing protein
MKFDIRTFIFILGILQVLQVLVFYYQYTANKGIKGLGWWLLWSATETFGFFIILLRNIPALTPLVIIFQDVILFSGTLFLYVGVMRFFDKKINLKFLISFFSAFVILHLSFLFIKNDITARSLIFAISISVISFVTAISIFRNKTKPIELTANLNTFIFVLHGLVFAWRAIMIISGIKFVDMFENSLFNLLPYLDALIASLLWTFGIIIMLNQKLAGEISEVKSRFELIFYNSPVAAAITRMNDGLLIDFNEPFSKIVGYTREDITGLSTLEIHFWKNPVERSDMIRILKDKGYCENLEVQLLRKGGDVFMGLFSARVISLGGVPHILSVTRDITEMKRADDEMRLKNEELKKINIEKDKFFSVIAHDLRNPFTAFLGYSEMMVEDLDSMTMDEIKGIATNLRNSSANLFSLLENLLEWSKAEQGMIRLNPESIAILPLITESISKIIDSAGAKRISIDYSVDDGMSVYADRHIFQTIIRNLVSNAVKFTHDGGQITIAAKENQDKEVEISVTDNGIGMNPEMVHNLFHLDAQINRKGTRGEPSTGLGLILCKGFIEKHGGRIWVESQEGVGSVFYFTIAAKKQ